MGVKEKQSSLANKSAAVSKDDNTVHDVGTLNEVTPISTVKEVETPYVVDMTVEKEKLCYVEDTTVLGSFPPLSTPVTTLAGNAPGKSSCANVTGKLSGKKLNIRTLFTPRGNEIDVVVPGKYGLVRSMFNSSTGLFSFQFSFMDGLDAMLKNGPWSSYARVMIELRADVELKDNIVMVMPNITREGHYTCNLRVEYEWKPPRYSSCKVFRHIHAEFPKNTGAEYRPVTKKPNASSSGNKKKGVEPTIEVSNSNPFDVLNSVDNDVEFVPMSIVESDSEVEVVFDEPANLRISTSGKDGSDKGYGTNSLLEQWRDSYPDNDEYDP
ncbi:hypothetical protein Tco_0524194 [Tanacetum coccineum]